MPSEADKELQHVLAPVKEHLARVSGANKRKIPNDMTRLEIMKVSLVVIGNHITNHVKQNDSLEDSLWKFVSDRYWPQGSKESKRVSGEKLKEMYVKIAAGKDAAI
jgi:chromodomain-helicase-DNA-binding protein 1